MDLILKVTTKSHQPSNSLPESCPYFGHIPFCLRLVADVGNWVVALVCRRSREYIWHRVQQSNYGCDNMSIGNNCWKPWHSRIPLLLHLVIIVLFIHDIPSKSRRRVLQMHLKYMGTNILCIYTHRERVCMCVYIHTHTHWSTLKCAAPSKRSIHLPILITSQTCCSINRQT